MLRRTIFSIIIALVILAFPQCQSAEAVLLRQPVQPVWQPAVSNNSLPGQPAETKAVLVRIDPLMALPQEAAKAGSEADAPEAERPAAPADLPVSLSMVTVVAKIHNNPGSSEPSRPAPAEPAPDRTIHQGKAMVALTFDDGPNNSVTPIILDTLKKHQAAATFFVVGRQVPGNQAVARRIIAEGHEIGNHTYDHKDLTRISINECLRQIELTQQAVIKATGVAPRLFRPPYGAINKTVLQHMPLPVVTWSIDPRDWEKTSVNAIVKAALHQVRDGDIILLHDSKRQAAEATKIIVPELIDRGYQLVTVSELFAARGIRLEPGKTVYRRAGQ